MKIQLASDLHLECLEMRFPGARIVEPGEGAGVRVLSMAVTPGGQSAATRAVLLHDCEWFAMTRSETNASMEAASEAALRVQVALPHAADSR